MAQKKDYKDLCLDRLPIQRGGSVSPLMNGVECSLFEALVASESRKISQGSIHLHGRAENGGRAFSVKTLRDNRVDGMHRGSESNFLSGRATRVRRGRN